MDLKERKERAKNILEGLYRGNYVETIYNTLNEKHQKQGWVLKSGIWSPWFFNLRPVGANPSIVADIAYVMNHMIREEVPKLTQIVGIEMAGVPLVSSIGTAQGPGCELIPYGYTRPLPQGYGKPRNPEEAKKVLSEMKADYGYGGKEVVEGRFEDGDNICITDDMVTNFGSKLIAKLIIEYEMERRGVIGVSIDHVAVVLDREQGAEEEAKKHGMYLHSLIKFKSEGLGWLKEIMPPQEYELLSGYQENPEKYQDEGLQKRVIEEANKLRGGN